MKSSLHLLITITTILYFILILSFILTILSQNSVKHSMTLNCTAVVVIVQTLSQISVSILYEGLKNCNFFRITCDVLNVQIRKKISNDFAILTLLYLYLKDNQAMCEVSEVQHKNIALMKF